MCAGPPVAQVWLTRMPCSTPPRQITDGHIVIQGAGGQSSGAGKNMFAFDFMYGPDSTQEQVYSDLGAPLLDKAFGGFNATIFACAYYHAAAC